MVEEEPWAEAAVRAEEAVEVLLEAAAVAAGEAAVLSGEEEAAGEAAALLPGVPVRAKPRVREGDSLGVPQGGPAKQAV